MIHPSKSNTFFTLQSCPTIKIVKSLEVDKSINIKLFQKKENESKVEAAFKVIYNTTGKIEATVLKRPDGVIQKFSNYFL